MACLMKYARCCKELNSLLQRVQQAFEAQQHFVADAAPGLRSPLATLHLQLQAFAKRLMTLRKKRRKSSWLQALSAPSDWWSNCWRWQGRRLRRPP